MVVFLPSYSFLDKVKAFWGQSGLMPKLGERKEVSLTSSYVKPCLSQKLKEMKLFYEPQASGDVETVLRDYALAISSVCPGLSPNQGPVRGHEGLIHTVPSWWQDQKDRCSAIRRRRRETFRRFSPTIQQNLLGYVTED